ncbi:rifin PIR protein, putative [Plasmodium reichenowi]|uniref:Rifin PIR protein, putative n=1 Tax=Plasmodium reichenowi TaxID=5854 RepID=A0A2P9D1F1_PLARE|nr:rifin PIR protein, putative [Plasmodium reichenowi]
MKVLYFNILLFTLPLNILPHNNNKPQTTPHTPKIPTTRLLCECELYAPGNYDNDSEMKKVMDKFNKQTQQRFHEYDDRMVEKRKQCKDQCDKESQKIILKDKLEKELMDKFATLQTDIQNDAIPTCICKKSIADKVEKGCLRCGGILGTAAPEFGVIGGNFVYAAAVNAATKAGMDAALDGLGSVPGVKLLLKDTFEKIVTSTNYSCKDSLFKSIDSIANSICKSKGSTQIYCRIKSGLEKMPFSRIENGISEAADMGAAAAEEAKTNALNATFTWETFFSSPLGISLLVTVYIIIILSIIYLILRYRRKKKMKKKLQYIKLLEE